MGYVTYAEGKICLNFSQKKKRSDSKRNIERIRAGAYDWI
jgi:hypothetical protein